MRRDSFVANAMADSEHAPMSEAIVGTATGQLAIASNAELSDRDFALVLCG
jgi:hypothetical protein